MAPTPQHLLTSLCWTLMWYLTPLSEMNSLSHRRHLYFPATKSPWHQNIGQVTTGPLSTQGEG